MTDTTRTTAKLAAWGIVLTIGGLVALVVAAHQSVFYTTLEALGAAPMQWDEFGNGSPAYNWAPPIALLAGILLVVGVWCLVAVVWRIADRVDGGSGHRPAASLLAAADVLRESPEDVEAYRAADRTPTVE